MQAWERMQRDDLAQRFVEDGYVIVEQVMSAHDVEAVRADIDRFGRGDYPVTNLPADGRILAVHFPHWVSPVAEQMIAHPGLVEVLARITGAHLPFWDGGVKCMQTMIFLKPPGLQGQAWHQDERYIPTRDRSLVGAWIALDEATIENGCLWVIPGSHRDGVLLPTGPHGQPDEFDASDAAQGVDDRTAVPVELHPGDAVFFNGYLLHRSLRNRSTGTRRSLVNHYMSTASNLPWLAHKGIDIGVTDNRAITVVSGDDPSAWKGITTPPREVFLRPAEGEWVLPHDGFIEDSTSV